MGLLDWLTGASKQEQIEDFVSRGAKVIDVRSAAEFNAGNANHSINIALDKIQEQLPKIKKLNSPIILVCQSGTRASMAASILKKNNIEVVNAGNWKNVA